MSQQKHHRHSLDNPESFWSYHANSLHWHQQPTSALRRTTKQITTSAGSSSHDHWTWFPDGRISTTYNCVDRHVENGNGDNVAIVWESAVAGEREEYTYRQLQDEVEVLAGVLREEGVCKGDVVIIYMPMIPAALFAALAITRLGAIHAAVFGGFAAPSLAQRIEAAKPRAIMTASCGIEGSKGALAYRPLVEGAIQQSAFKPEKVIIWQREQLRWNHPDKLGGQRNWQRIVKSGRTTGLPKGVVREAGGHAVGLSLSVRYMFGIRGPGDIIFCASDIGWVVGHSYILYAPLLVGATTILFEGKPIGTPDAGIFWRVIERNKANVLFTAPTALRAIRKDDPDNRYFTQVGKRGGLKSLKALFLAGERSEPSIVQSYQDLLSQWAAPGALVIDNWWSSESGSPITGLALRPKLAMTASLPLAVEYDRPLPIRPGSAGMPMPGFDVRIVDDNGDEVVHGIMGNIVLGVPLAPTAFTTLFNDDERFYKSYLQRFSGRWLDTGDAGMIDQDGYVHVMSRSDDIINVAAHRFSTGPSSLSLSLPCSIEQAILSHPLISEASVVSIPDAIKGHLPFAFVQLKSRPGVEKNIPATPPAAFVSEINALVRTHIGPIASLGGVIQGRGMIPKTRSGKTLRRVLRELVENAAAAAASSDSDGYDKAVNVPPTIEDVDVIEVARARVKEYFVDRGKEKKTKARL
ncbi:hypothetical protein UA08_04419 [Talaromyces atroroseus]|uniref:Acyl-CoA synthetase short-chain family member 3, mitochondrial n=1 Tax=Talaromyces atroroseus TaxID=1441469 RepID=A0A1Q5Q8R5_TALAT|nr:hypothetical protein UA08_04419 [Talaromyces atroroseus]OKL60505.1 hypothetical protein UA08_04419 [Talaromyces atroroseus]